MLLHINIEEKLDSIALDNFKIFYKEIEQNFEHQFKIEMFPHFICKIYFVVKLDNVYVVKVSKILFMSFKCLIRSHVATLLSCRWDSIK